MKSSSKERLLPAPAHLPFPARMSSCHLEHDPHGPLLVLCSRLDSDGEDATQQTRGHGVSPGRSLGSTRAEQSPEEGKVTHPKSCGQDFRATIY